MLIDYKNFIYEVPEYWYEGLYKDEVKPCNAGRPFKLINNSDECWLLIHGYRGYPGELVRPAYDLYLNGYDVYVPRLPGNGTSGSDFVKTNSNDWLGLVKNAIADLKTKYKKVNLLGHSMGAALCAIEGAKDLNINKIIYAAPSFENLQMPFRVRLYLRFLSLFTYKIKAPWKRTNSHHHYYEGAPADEDYLGDEYYKWNFTAKLIDYYKISKMGLKAIKNNDHHHLFICPKKDTNISGASLKEYIDVLNKKANYIEIDNGTHLIFYDIDIEAEEKAVKVVIEFAKK